MKQAPSLYFGLVGVAALLLDEAMEIVRPHVQDEEVRKQPGLQLRG